MKAWMLLDAPKSLGHAAEASVGMKEKGDMNITQNFSENVTELWRIFQRMYRERNLQAATLWARISDDNEDIDDEVDVVDEDGDGEADEDGEADS